MSKADKGSSKNNDDSQIRKFFSGKNILLTECTGFFGNVILEKLLRSCTDMGKVYVLIRPEENMSMKRQIEKIYQEDIFKNLKETNPDFGKKLVAIYAELEKEDLGLSPEDRRQLVKNIDVIIHNASLMCPQTKVSRFLRTNVIATQKILELATECTRLEAMVYVSTAYSHPYNKTPEEKFYPPPADLKIIQDIIKADEENETGITDEVVRDFIGKWSNLYIFSKAVAEGLVENFGRRKSLPCIVFRPAMVGTTYTHPVKPWLGYQNAIIKFIMGIMWGYLHMLPVNKEFPIDGIPVDMATNALLTSTWDYVVHRKSKEPEVYTYASSDWNRLTYSTGITSILNTALNNPSPKMIWYPFIVYASNFYLCAILHMMFHVFPAMIVDVVRVIQGEKPMVFCPALMGLKYQSMIREFMNSNWCIKADKLKELRNQMNPGDVAQFPIDLSKLNWNEYISSYVSNARKIMNEPQQSTSEGSKKLQCVTIRHYIVTALFTLIVLFFFYNVMLNLF